MNLKYYLGWSPETYKTVYKIMIDCMCYAIHWGRLTCLLTKVPTTCSFHEIYIIFLNETFIWERWWNCNHYHEKALRYIAYNDNIFEDQNPIMFCGLCNIMISSYIDMHVFAYGNIWYILFIHKPEFSFYFIRRKEKYNQFLRLSCNHGKRKK